LKLNSCIKPFSDITIEENGYYAVFYDDPATYYIGRVLMKCHCGSIDEDHYKVKFLKHDALTKEFSWPRAKDEECVSAYWIFQGPLDIVGHDPFTIPEIGVVIEDFHVFRRRHMVKQSLEL
jgi:hypothetical protein